MTIAATEIKYTENCVEDLNLIEANLEHILLEEYNQEMVNDVNFWI